MVESDTKVYPDIVYLKDFLVIKEPISEDSYGNVRQCLHVQSMKKDQSLSETITISQGNNTLKQSSDVSIQAVTPYTALKQMRFEDFREEDYDILANQIQVTADGLNNIYSIILHRGTIKANMKLQELNIDNTVDEQKAEFFDPNNFVELGMSISVKDEYENWDSQLKKVNTLNASEFGNVVRFSQRAVEAEDFRDDQLD